MRRARSLLLGCMALALCGCNFGGAMVDPTDPPFPMTAEQLHAIINSNQIYVRSVGGDGKVIIDCRCGPKVPLREISPYVVKALIATEDIRFYSHKGFDPISTTRALTKNILGMRKAEGGSTIEMQICKSKILRTDKGIKRKWTERSCAKAVAAAMSKDDILLAYLNSAYLGEGRGGQPTYGIEQAARTIFGKQASELLLYEAAVLVGMLKAPDSNNPIKHPEEANKRAQVVLKQLLKHKFVTQKEYGTAKKSRIKIGQLKHLKFEHRYFTDWVIKSIQGQSIKLEAGMHIPITLQVATQAGAETAFKVALEKSGLDVLQPAGFGTIRADGKVIAMMGGREYKTSQFNSFVYGKRPPASTFKAIVYAVAVEGGLKLRESVFDGRFEGENWKPNLLESAKGMISISEAFAQSRNIPAIRIANRVGYGAVVKLAKKMGIADKLRADQNLVLGGYEVSPLTITSAFTTFTNEGVHVPPYGFYGAVDKYGSVIHWPNRIGKKAIKPKTALAMQKLMRGVVDNGTGKPASFIKNAKGKTGTSDDNKDGWFIGFTEKTVTGVWLGTGKNDGDIPVNGALATKVWAGIVQSY